MTPKLLAMGTLSNVAATLYSPPTGMRTKIEAVIACKATAGALNVFFNINSTGSMGGPFRINETNVAANVGATIFDSLTPIYLDSANGESIEGNAAAAASVNYFIFGQEEQKG